ncbi:tyrosine-type recombinase/integrase [Clostridium estertheticum]|uniref:Tyrosine-type recombinase/integrase n=1 Tax=Clostridium estertheticum TaxID=238834 RepID=A0A7Y3SZJ1_9CLOT|nr:tyrosine-type recombinase/integrase [Clostridium estertheticum]NNU78122.1 tyrosine-type recombinase/integrase [Clostridium estertheticum]WBL47766.1 tyrosine-type recombinase/integrase [Clostridium estertheticum]
MNMTYPLKDKKQIDMVKLYLKSKSIRNFLLFTIGISSALRISDILSLRISQIYDGHKATDFIDVKEKKTGKSKRFATSSNLQSAIKIFIKQYKPTQDEYVFISRKGSNKPITRQRAVQILTEALDMCGLSNINFGSHGMRKTFAYHCWKKGTDITYLMRILNHSSPKEVLHYISVEQEELDDIYVNLNL